MKVLDLRCSNGHGFEGWFASDDDYMLQNGRGMVECPLCADRVVSRLPSAPRLNLSGARAPEFPTTAAASETAASAAKGAPPAPAAAPPQAGDLQLAWLAAARRVLSQTEDVGSRFAEEARRIHYGETPQRGIRGQATKEERLALLDEGIETMAFPLPHALEGPVQ